MRGGVGAPPLRPCVYVFRGPDGAPLYVGKAGRNPGDRIKAHFDGRRAHALACASIDVHWLPHGTPEVGVLALEEQLIRSLRPPSNKAHNWGHHDRGWVHRVEREHARAAGVRLGWGDGVRLWWEVLCGRVVRGGRWLGGLVVVDVVLRVVVAALL